MVFACDGSRRRNTFSKSNPGIGSVRGLWWVWSREGRGRWVWSSVWHGLLAASVSYIRTHSPYRVRERERGRERERREEGGRRERGGREGGRREGGREEGGGSRKEGVGSREGERESGKVEVEGRRMV